jgi:hypothetical protein
MPIETSLTNHKQLQTQAIKALGRGFLVSRLICEGIGVSLPLWDDGIDLIAHVRNLKQQRFEARPLQLKVSSNTYVGLYEKYEQTPNLRMVFIWLSQPTEQSRIFVMPYKSLYEMFSAHKHLISPSWTRNRIGERSYSTSRASLEKLEYMAKFEVCNKSLRELIFGD